VSDTPDPLGNAAFLVFAIALAGIGHVLWLRIPLSQRLSQPIDAGLSWRGRRLFGENKMLRGFIVMPFATALSFGVLASLHDEMPTWLAAGLWNRGLSEYVLLGFGCGLAFMLAELPNSFIKRQLGVPPGAKASTPVLRWVLSVTDRLDSELGVLVLVSLLLPIQPLTWFWVLLIGPIAHTCFSVWLFLLGVKGRAL